MPSEQHKRRLTRLPKIQSRRMPPLVNILLVSLVDLFAIVPVVTKNTFMGMLQKVKEDQKSRDETEKVVEEKSTTKQSGPAVDWLKSDFSTAKAAKHWDESDSE